MPPRQVETAVVGLRYLGADAAPAVGLLLDILSHETPGVLDLDAVETLGELGDTARPAIANLKQLTKVREVRLRQAANNALQRIISSSQNSELDRKQPEADEPRTGSE